jgi:adenine deaminase
MELEKRKRLIDVASGREQADLVIVGAHIVDVYNGRLIEGDVAIVDGHIAGIGSYEGRTTYDAGGAFLLPGLIDGHVHIESSLVDPQSFSKLVVPHGTTTVIADPHEICNVCGLEGFDYMVEASGHLPLEVFFMLPSCVPATAFEHSGAVLDAGVLSKRIGETRVLGLGEMMDMVGTIAAEGAILDKLALSEANGKLTDGHAPSVAGNGLNAYVAASIHTDHECATVEEMNDRISRGMYVLLREGSACHDVRNLLKGVTERNAHMCLFCTDDRQPRSILESGHIDNHLRIAVEEGLDPILAVRMATLSAADCYRLYDRGAIAPGKLADLVVVKDLKSFEVVDVFTSGLRYDEDRWDSHIPSVPSVVSGRVDIGKFDESSLHLNLKSPHVRVIDIHSESVVTGSSTATVQLDAENRYVQDSSQDIVKLAVVERHKGTGHVGLALIRGYGITDGAVATTIAHDSHNIIVAGDNDRDMALAVHQVAELGGGIVMVMAGKVIDSLPLPIAGLMTNLGGPYVEEKFQSMHRKAKELLKIHEGIDPFMTLSFMALPVIPHLKVTDMGLFDVDSFSFVPMEQEP